MKILITGDCGFIGTHTKRALKKKGYEVIGYDIKRDPREDICNSEHLSYFIEKGDKILHLAAVSRFRDADNNPAEAWRTNVGGTASVLETATKKKAERIVYSSTGSALMPIWTNPITEHNTDLEGNSHYGMTKAAAEKLFRLSQYKVPYVILRYGHIYGKGKIGHGAVNIFIERMERGLKPVIYGGKQSNEFCLSGKTKILMSDFSWKNIKDIKIGEKVISFDEQPINKKRKFKISKVVANSKRKDILYEIKTTDGTIKATRKHPFLTEKNRYSKVENLVDKSKLRKFSQPVDFKENNKYRQGYIAGVFDGDGSIGVYQYKNKPKNYRATLFVTDKDFSDYFTKCLKCFDLKPIRAERQPNYPNAKREYGVLICKKSDYEKVSAIIRNKDFGNEDFCKGWLAGIYDSEGESMANKIHLIVASNNNDKIIKRIESILEKFNFKFSTHIKKDGCKLVQMLGGLNEHIRFFSLFRPSIKRKYPDIKKREVKGKKANIISIKEIGIDNVYNLEIENTHTFIANGFLTHNCYIKDIVQANIKALETENTNEVYNIGYGKDYTIQEVYNIINKILDKNIKPEYGPARVVDAPFFAYDISRARRMLGYRPKWDLKAGIKDMIKEMGIK